MPITFRIADMHSAPRGAVIQAHHDVPGHESGMILHARGCPLAGLSTRGVRTSRCTDCIGPSPPIFTASVGTGMVVAQTDCGVILHNGHSMREWAPPQDSVMPTVVVVDAPESVILDWRISLLAMSEAVEQAQLDEAVHILVQQEAEAERVAKARDAAREVWAAEQLAIQIAEERCALLRQSRLEIGCHVVVQDDPAFAKMKKRDREQISLEGQACVIVRLEGASTQPMVVVKTACGLAAVKRSRVRRILADGRIGEPDI